VRDDLLEQQLPKLRSAETRILSLLCQFSVWPENLPYRKGDRIPVWLALPPGKNFSLVVVKYTLKDSRPRHCQGLFVVGAIALPMP
jgi:hypothetical protein